MIFVDISTTALTSSPVVHERGGRDHDSLFLTVFVDDRLFARMHLTVLEGTEYRTLGAGCVAVFVDVVAVLSFPFAEVALERGRWCR